jgi:cytochrome c-type biogenesis protein CcmE
MKWFYIRWGGILLTVLIITVLGVQRYRQEVSTISPEQLLRGQSTETARVLGTVQAGSLSSSSEESTPIYQARFRLSGERETLPVQYIGEKPDNLRELKSLVVVGQWNAASGEFVAREIQLLPNFGYVAAAYLIVMIPMGLFLFRMERKVELLYTEIKSAKMYEAEESAFDKG